MSQIKFTPISAGRARGSRLIVLGAAVLLAAAALAAAPLGGAAPAAARPAATPAATPANPPTAIASSASSASSADSIARGAYLARAGDCASCHTAGPHAPALAGGLHMNTPFGAIISSNITPDPEYGIGRYSLAQFSDALRHGIRADGSHLYPAMPFASFARMSDGDVADLFAYLQKAVAPVHSKPPPTALPFPFNQRWGLAVWDAMFLPSGPFVAQPERGPAWNRGAYLVQTLGHCGACHTPRGLLFQERGYDDGAPLYLSGGELDHWYAPNLGPDPVSGMGRRSVGQLVSLLRSGHGAGANVYGPMVDVMSQSTSQLSEPDLLAIATYIKALPPRAGGKLLPLAPRGAGQSAGAADRQAAAPAVSPPPTVAAGIDAVAAARARGGVAELPGAGVYSGFCQRCHGAAGQGQPPKHPALAGSPTVQAPNGASLLRIVLEGSDSPSIVHGPMSHRMPAFAPKLSDSDIADVLSYVRNSWGNRATPLTARAAASMRATLAQEAAQRALRESKGRQ